MSILNEDLTDPCHVIKIVKTGELETQWARTTAAMLSI